MLREVEVATRQERQIRLAGRIFAGDAEQSEWANLIEMEALSFPKSAPEPLKKTLDKTEH
jgi:hypothetical protein